MTRGRTLYDRATDITQAVYAFVREQGTGHSVSLGELALYGCHMGPMLAGRVLREYWHIIRDDCRLVADVTYDAENRRIRVEPLAPTG